MKSKKARTLRSLVGSFIPAVAAEKVQQLVSTIDPSTSYSREERKSVLSQSIRVPDALIERVADLAEQGGGTVLGISFDVDAARQTLAYSRACRAVIAAARSFARMISDDVLRQRVVVAQRAFAIYGAMGRLVQTGEDKRLIAPYEELQTLVRAERRRTRAAKAKTDAKANVTPTPSTDVVVKTAP